jgi:hypothetical protein
MKIKHEPLIRVVKKAEISFGKNLALPCLP